MTDYSKTDLLEDDILSDSAELMRLLLIDRNTSKHDASGLVTDYHAIIWATDDYAAMGAGYGFYDEITPRLITGPERGCVIQPRVKKEQQRQDERSKGMAEVFTPAWMCNEQNNLVDDAWFGRRNVFNVPNDCRDGLPWTATTSPITDFPEGKTWEDYVKANRLEICCGEAPYLTSRYDAVSGERIPFDQRVGLLDRKLRLVSENCDDAGRWLHMARMGYQSVYGYEWQGDSLLLAREALLATFVEAFEQKFGRQPQLGSKKSIAGIISWNIWQMDGLRCVVPGSCHHGERRTVSNWTGEQEETIRCKGCEDATINGHLGTSCYVMDWRHRKARRQTFASILNNKC